MERKSLNNALLEEAYFTLRKRLDSVANSYNVPKEIAEELIQEGYVKLSDKPLTSKEEANGKFWITVRNIAIDMFRKQRFSIPLEENLTKTEFSEQNYSDIDRIMKQMQELLSPVQYRIMYLLVVEEMEYSEIAKTLNINEGAVRTNVCRARKLLKEKLER